MRVSEIVARRIRTLLDERLMTQYRLAQNIAMHHNTLTSIMQAKNKSVNLKTIILITRGLGVTVEEFFRDPQFENSDLDVD